MSHQISYDATVGMKPKRSIDSLLCCVFASHYMCTCRYPIVVLEISGFRCKDRRR